MLVVVILISFDIDRLKKSLFGPCIFFLNEMKLFCIRFCESDKPEKL